MKRRPVRFPWHAGNAFAATLCIAACAVGPDYHRPTIQLPDGFKEGAEWQRAQANPQGAISSTWWGDYHDEDLSRLIQDALRANQSIAVAEANYRLALATVASNVASLFPTVTAALSGTRSESVTSGGVLGASASTGAQTVVSTNVTASWEPDLWGQIRRQIEASRDGAQATDAELAGERLSIAW